MNILSDVMALDWIILQIFDIKTNIFIICNMSGILINSSINEQVVLLALEQIVTLCNGFTPQGEGH